MHSIQRYARNLAFYLIIFTGGLLSLVSIIVVLEMRDPAVPDELSAAALRQSLDTAQAISRDQHFAVIPTADSTLERAIATDTIRHRGTLLTLHAAHRAAAEAWSIRRTAVLAAQAEAAEAVADTWRVDSGRTGNRDHEERFLELRDWYRGEMRRTDAYLDSGRVHLASAFAALTSLRQASAPAAVAASEAEVREHLRRTHALLARYAGIGSIPAFGADQRLFDKGSLIPHPVAALSDWLRTSRSMELASVIGMLGVGLLGAAASTVVRQRGAAPDTGLVLGSGITSLLLSGVSAALATYLAMKGGLAVTASEDAQPNEYVLLLTCFVAAVYWEEAWERVRKLASGSGQPGADTTETPVTSAPDQPSTTLPAASATEATDATEKADPAPRMIPAPVDKIVGETEAAAVNVDSGAAG